MNAPPAAGLSVDLDNLWSYLRARGDPRWTTRPSFLPLTIPRIVRTLDDCGLTATAFVVGRDAEQSADATAIRALIDAGHELGNHSYGHEPGFHTYGAAELEADFAHSEAALRTLGAGLPRGFRGPSFRLSRNVLEMLAERGYEYDASTYPNAAGALARAWQRAHFELDRDDSATLAGQYGTLRDACLPLAPFRWRLRARELVELPVSTLPLLRLPVHFTYLNYLADRSATLARAYVRAHIGLCRVRRLAPSLLLHATDFIGADDAQCPHFMPGMCRPTARKLDFLRTVLDLYRGAFDLLPLGRHVDALRARGELDLREPPFPG